MDVNFLSAVDLFHIHLELFKRKNFDLFTIQNGKKHKKQELALKYLTDLTTKEVAYGGGAGGAKSFTGAYWLTMVCHVYPGSSWFVCREQLKDLRNTFGSTLRKVWNITGLNHSQVNYNGQDNYFEFANGSKIYYMVGSLLPSDPDFERFGSYELAGGMFEEAGQLTGMAIETLISRCGRDIYDIPIKIFTTFNPNKGAVYNRYYKPYKKNTLKSNVVFIPSLVHDNPFASKAYIESLENITDQRIKQRLLYGNFDFDDDPRKLIDPEAIDNMFSNAYVEEGLKCITVDPAGKGKDSCVINVWNGWRAIYTQVRIKVTQDWLLDQIEKLRLKFQIPKSQVGIDYAGLGTGVTDIGGYKPIIVAGSPIEVTADKILKAKQKEFYVPYHNIRSQLWHITSDKINKNQVYIDMQGFDLNSDITPTEYQELLAEDLDVVKLAIGDNKTKKIISKGSISSTPGQETMKQLLGRSPDYGDNIMHRAFFELRKPINPGMFLA